ncbi:MAG: hypothetical protein V1820_00765, partial [archaeon]
MNVPKIPDGELVRAKDRKKIAILVHGFTGMPNEFMGLKDELKKRGISSFGYELGFSESNIANFRKVTVSGEVRKLKRIISAISERYKKTFLIGGSFGGLVANHA